MRSKPIFLLGLLLAIVLALGYHLQPKPRYQIEAAAPGQIVSEEHFSPSENLERMDYDRLERAQHRVDIAMYGFTDRYLAEELVRRRILGYPPFGTLVRIICSSVEAPAAQTVSDVIAERILAAPGLELQPPQASLLGPAPLFRLRGRSRMQLLLKTPRRRAAIAAAGAAVAGVAQHASRAGVNLSVDVDPQ